MWQQVDRAAAAIREAGPATLDLAVILGSGLGAFAESIDEAVDVPYDGIAGFPTPSAVAGHAGRLVIGRVGGQSVGAFCGRFHHYEGYEPHQIVMPVRVAHALGARILVVTNAAGSVNSNHPPGTLMLITDHVNMLGFNPLRGANDETRGPRFPSLNAAYTPRLRALAAGVAAERGIELVEGVYLAATGPTYETPAEIRAFGGMGADAVGMSTVPETIAAVHLGMEVLGISCLTNWAAGMADEPPTHAEVIETGRQVASTFVDLLRSTIEAIGA